MRFAEITDPSDYVTKGLDAIAKGRIPVLVPSDPDRRSRWRHVLKHYDAILGPHVLQPASRGEGRLIALDPASEDVAFILSRALGLTLVSASGRLLSPASQVPTVYVGLLRSLGAAFLRRIAAVAPAASWSVVAGLDREGLSFTAAKLLALGGATPARTDAVLVDVIGATLTSVESDGRKTMLESSWCVTRNSCHTLVLHVHGEGGHADLGDAVACGLIGPCEQMLHGQRIAGGCSAEGGGRCKRRADRHVAIVPFHQIPANRVALLSCNGWSPVGEGYPSDLSAPASLLEGFAAEVVTTLRPVAFSPGLPGVCARLAAGARDLTPMLDLVSDVARRDGHMASYVRVGLHRKTTPGFDGRRDVVPAISTAVVEASNAVVRGATWVASIDGRPVGALRDRNREVEALEIETGQLCQRVQRAERWQRRLARMADATDEPAMVAATEALEDVRGALDAVEATIARSRATGVVDATLQLAGELASTTVRIWDRAFAELLDAGGLGANLLATFHGGWAVGRPEPHEQCFRCRAAVEWRDMIGFVSGPARVGACPNCGEAGLVWPTEGALVVEVPAEVTPGTRFVIQARRRPAAGQGPTDAWIVVHLKDKAAGDVLVRQLIRSREPVVTVPIDVPSSCPPDLHTLKVAWVEKLTLSFVRQRISCLPKPCELP